MLDEQIAYMRDSLARLTEDPYSQARFYVTEDDIASLPCFGNDSIFAVKAPRGTTLEVPDPHGHLGVARSAALQVCSATVKTNSGHWILTNTEWAGGISTAEWQ